MGDISELKIRLEKRDKITYDYDLLKLLQDNELSHATYISKELGINLNIGTQNDFSTLLNSLKKTFS
ncbi:MAG: hypothetical protein RL308_1056 [Bacteroidota bacterium]